MNIQAHQFKTAHQFTTLSLLALILLCGLAPTAQAGDIEKIDFAEAYDPEENILPGPVFEGASVPPLRFEALESTFDRNALFVRRIPGGFVRVPQHGLAGSVDIGQILAETLRSEAVTMGLRSQPESEAAVVRGRITEAFLETRGVVGGALLYFGYLGVDLTVTWPDGREEPLEGTFHGMYARYNGGFGTRDEASEATGRFLIDIAQEIVSRISRHHLQAPVHPGVSQALNSLASSGVEDRHPVLRRVGFSGLEEAVPILLDLLTKEKDEGERAHLIDALANFEHADVVSRLAARYRGEKDEDCRFYSLKAFAYAQSEEGLEWIRELGKSEKDKAAKRLAQYSTAAK